MGNGRLSSSSWRHSWTSTSEATLRCGCCQPGHGGPPSSQGNACDHRAHLQRPFLMLVENVIQVCTPVQQWNSPAKVPGLAWKSQVSSGFIDENLTSRRKLLICFLFPALACTSQHLVFVPKVCSPGFLPFPLHPPCCASGWGRQAELCFANPRAGAGAPDTPSASDCHDRNIHAHCHY